MTLETRGEHTFGGRLNPVSPFSAHPHFDPATGRMVSFGISFSSDRPTVNLYRFGPDGGLLDRRRVPLPYPASLHDFGLSPRFAIFYVNPYLLDMAPLMAEGANVLDCLSWHPELGSSLLVVERETGEVAATVPVGEGYCLHHVNAWEEEAADGSVRLVVDVLELEEPVYPDYKPVPDLFVDVAPTHPVRYVVDVAAGTVASREEVPHRLAADFPHIDSRLMERRADRFWMLAISKTGAHGRKFLDRLASVDLGEGAEVDAWDAPAGRYLGGEPVFVPAPGEGAGAGDAAGSIVIQELDPATRSMAFLFFDAHDLAHGPTARLPLKSPVHLGFHACWQPG